MKNYPEHLTSKYEMLECLAFHDLSETILSRRRSDGKLCSLKIFFSGSPLYDFVVPEEIKTLEHPFIPRFFEEFKSEELRCEIREFVPGVSLDKLVQIKQLSKPEKDRITRQLCEILQFLHTRTIPVIHRDIKPENIIVSDTENLYLIDFGIARTQKFMPESSDTVICATREFSAPEQYGFMETGIRSDIYSFGKVLEWLYVDDSKEIQYIIDKCTAFDPEKRFSSIKEVRHVFAAKRKAHKLLYPVAISAIILLCLTGVWAHMRGRNRFDEPLIEEAVRLSLGVSELHPITNRDLQKVEHIYIVADKVYATSDEFYEAVDDWYINDRDSEGTIDSLEDCSRLKNLREFCIAGNKISDLSPLLACNQLEKLEVKKNNISDISILENIPTLISVGINSNPVTDISPLIKLKRLRYLDTCNVKISDPSVFEKLGGFEYLDIDNGTQAYKYLSGKTIRVLRLGNIYTKDLSFLKEINGLEKVQLNFINYDNIQKLGNVDYAVVYEGVDVPVQEVLFDKKRKKRRSSL